MFFFYLLNLHASLSGNISTALKKGAILIIQQLQVQIILIFCHISKNNNLIYHGTQGWFHGCVTYAVT